MKKFESLYHKSVFGKSVEGDKAKSSATIFKTDFGDGDITVRPSLVQQSIFVLRWRSGISSELCIEQHLRNTGIEFSKARDEIRFRLEGEQANTLRELIKVVKAHSLESASSVR